MITGLLVLLASALIAWWLSGARSAAYLLYYVSFTPFVTLDLTEGGLQTTDELGSALVLVKVIVRAASAAGILFLLVRRSRALALFVNPRLFPAVFFLLWALLGLMSTREPLLPLLRLGELAVFVAVGAVLWAESLRTDSLRCILRWHALALLPLITITAYYVKTHPALAVHISEDGMVRMGNRLINAETLGTVSALLLLWSSFELKEPRERREGWMRERLLPMFCLALGAATLVLARSRAAMIAAIIGEVILWSPFFGATRRRWISSIAVLGLALVWLAMHPGDVEAWFLRGDSVASLRSATGRTGLWAHLFEDAGQEHPLLGNGYLNLSEKGGFWHAGSYWTNAHNAYLGALLYTGLPGFLAISTLVFLPIRAAWRRARTACSERGAWTLVLAFSVLAASSSLTSFGICGWPNPLMLFFFALFPIAVCGPRDSRAVEEEVPALEPDSVAYPART